MCHFIDENNVFFSCSDFAINYRVLDDYGGETILPMVSDWDLNAAFLSASNPGKLTATAVCYLPTTLLSANLPLTFVHIVLYKHSGLVNDVLRPWDNDN